MAIYVNGSRVLGRVKVNGANVAKVRVNGTEVWSWQHKATVRLAYKNFNGGHNWGYGDPTIDTLPFFAGSSVANKDVFELGADVLWASANRPSTSGTKNFSIYLKGSRAKNFFSSIQVQNYTYIGVGSDNTTLYSANASHSYYASGNYTTWTWQNVLPSEAWGYYGNNYPYDILFNR